MTFKEWLEKRKWSDQEAAEFFGISRPCINRIKLGRRDPTFEHCARIWVGTKGKVKLADWIDGETYAKLREEVGA